MKKIGLIYLMLTIMLTGCASIHQTFIADNGETQSGAYQYKSRVYAGVRNDSMVIAACFTSGWAFFICPIALLTAIDVPFSFAADTLFLPYTMLIEPKISQSIRAKFEAAEKERGLARDFVRNNKVVIDESGGIRRLSAPKNIAKREAIQNRYVINVKGQNKKRFSAIVGVSRSQEHTTFYLECISPVIWRSSRDAHKDICAEQ